MWGKFDVVYYTSGTSGKLDLDFNGTNVNRNAALLDNKPAVQGSSNLGIGCFASTTVERAFWAEVDEVRFLAGSTRLAGRARGGQSPSPRACLAAAVETPPPMARFRPCRTRAGVV